MDANEKGMHEGVEDGVAADYFGLNVNRRWGKTWAEDPENAGALERLADAVEAEEREGWSIADGVEIANRDANGAGTVYAQVLLRDPADEEADRVCRDEAWDFWQCMSGQDDNDAVDDIMYDGVTLAEFVEGAMSVWLARP